MRKILYTLIISSVIAVGLPATALAGGGNYFPPVALPESAPSAKPSTAQSTPATQPTCNAPTTPVMTVSSPSGDTINQNSPGVWTVAMYPGEDFADWNVSWTGSTGTTYSFEVSDSSNTDPATGQFTSPITADNVSGSQTTSNTMQISPEEVYYFHVKATACGKDVYSPIGQINTALNDQVPSTLASNGSNGTKGLQLLGFMGILAAAYVVTKRSSLLPLVRSLKPTPKPSR